MSVLSNLPPLPYTTHVDAGDLLQILLTQKILSNTTRLTSRRKYSTCAFNNSTWSPNILFHKQHLLHRQTPDHFSHAPRLPLLIYSDYCWSISSWLHHYFILLHHLNYSITLLQVTSTLPWQSPSLCLYLNNTGLNNSYYLEYSSLQFIENHIQLMPKPHPCTNHIQLQYIHINIQN